MKIDKGIPLPPRYATAKLRLPLAQLEVGDSFLVPRPVEENKNFHKNLTSRVCTYSKHTGKRFATRVVEGGIRVWRIA